MKSFKEYLGEDRKSVSTNEIIQHLEKHIPKFYKNPKTQYKIEQDSINGVCFYWGNMSMKEMKKYDRQHPSHAFKISISGGYIRVIPINKYHNTIDLLRKSDNGFKFPTNKPLANGIEATKEVIKWLKSLEKKLSEYLP